MTPLRQQPRPPKRCRCGRGKGRSSKWRGHASLKRASHQRTHRERTAVARLRQTRPSLTRFVEREAKPARRKGLPRTATAHQPRLASGSNQMYSEPRRCLTSEFSGGGTPSDGTTCYTEISPTVLSLEPRFQRSAANGVPPARQGQRPGSFGSVSI